MVLVAVLWLAGLVGCSAKPASQGITITYQTMETLPAQRQALTRLVAEFEKLHPAIHVKVQISPSGFQKLQAQIAAGTLPDVFYYISDRLPLLVAHKAVLDLKPFMQQEPTVETSTYYQKTIDSCIVAGGVYCFPFHFSTDILFYNKDLFDKAGLAYPNDTWTWEDFFQAATLLTRREGAKTVQYGTLAPRPMLLIKAFGGNCFESSRCVIDSEPSRKALEFLQSLTRSGVIPQTAALRDIEVMDGVTLFSTGRIAMLLGRTYMMSEFGRLKDFSWDIALVPKGDRRYSRLAVGGNSISAKTKHPKEAWEFVRFFSGPVGSKILGEFRNGAPALQAIAQSETFLRTPPASVVSFLAAIDTAEIENPGMILWQEYLDKVLQPNVDNVLFGKNSVQDALRAMQSKGEDYLKEESLPKDPNP